MSTLASADRDLVARIVDRVHRQPAATALLNRRIADLMQQRAAANSFAADLERTAAGLARDRAAVLEELTRARLEIHSLRRSRSAHERRSREAREVLTAARREAKHAVRELARETAAHIATRRELRLARARNRRLERKDTP